MKKIIKQIGNSIGITFNKEEKKINEIKKGDIIDVEIVKIRREKDGFKKLNERRA